MTSGVPLLPAAEQVDPDTLGRYHRSCGRLRDEMQALPDLVAVLFGRLQRRVIVESIAGVGPIARRGLAVPRRRMLSASADARLRGCDAGWHHVEALLAGPSDRPLGRETLLTVHALACAHSLGTPREAGLIRTSGTGFDPSDTAYVPPGAESCVPLVDAAFDVVATAPLSAIERAAWFASVLLAIHPFADANGRTTRLLFQLIAGSDAAGADLGSPEVWALQRHDYLAALRRSQAGARSVAEVDPGPFVVFALGAGAVGAERVRHRVAALRQVWEAPWDSASEPARTIEVAVACSSTATLAELAELVDEPRCTTVVAELVDGGRLRWDASGLLRVAEGHPLVSP